MKIVGQHPKSKIFVPHIPEHPEPFATISPVFRSDVHSIHIFYPFMEPSLSLSDLHIIPAHHPFLHTPILCKRPILQPIAPLPLHPIFGVLILIPELDGDFVSGEGEQFFSETIRLLTLPFGSKERYDGFSAGEEGGAVAPNTTWCVSRSDGGRLLGVPEGLRGFYLGRCRFMREGWARWGHALLPDDWVRRSLGREKLVSRKR